MHMQPVPGKLSKTVWIVAYLLTPALPFVCLRIERAVSTFQCILGVLAALLVQFGLISVLGDTNGQPLQLFIVLLLFASTYLVVFWQYLAGHAVALWSAEAELQWRQAARFFGGILALGLAAAILSFHFAPR